VYSFPFESTIDSIDIILLSIKFKIKNLSKFPISNVVDFLLADIAFTDFFNK